MRAMSMSPESVELHIYEGEKHGWRRTETRIDELVRVEAFLDRFTRRVHIEERP